MHLQPVTLEQDNTVIVSYEVLHLVLPLLLSTPTTGHLLQHAGCCCRGTSMHQHTFSRHVHPNLPNLVAPVAHRQRRWSMQQHPLELCPAAPLTTTLSHTVCQNLNFCTVKTREWSTWCSCRHMTSPCTCRIGIRVFDKNPQCDWSMTPVSCFTSTIVRLRNTDGVTVGNRVSRVPATPPQVSVFYFCTITNK